MAVGAKVKGMKPKQISVGLSRLSHAEENIDLRAEFGLPEARQTERSETFLTHLRNSEVRLIILHTIHDKKYGKILYFNIRLPDTSFLSNSDDSSVDQSGKLNQIRPRQSIDSYLGRSALLYFQAF